MAAIYRAETVGGMVLCSLGLPAIPYVLIQGTDKPPKPFRKFLANTVGVVLGIVLIPMSIAGIVIGAWRE